MHQTCPPFITLPTVPAECFGILLAGMYSGSYDVNNENVYQACFNLDDYLVLNNLII